VTSLAAFLTLVQENVKFPDQFNGYTRIEYMSVFVSFLYAFVLAEFFEGWARMVRNRNTITFSANHLIYSILFFWILILNWWSLWVRMPYLGNGFVYFILIIIPLGISYFVTVQLFPNMEREKDLANYFDRNFRVIGIGLSLFILVNLGIGILMQEKVGLSVNLFRLAVGLFIFIVAFFNLSKLRLLFAIIMGIILLAGSIQVAFL